MTVVQISPPRTKAQDAQTDKKSRPEPEKVLHDFSDSVEQIATKLIPKHHPELVNANIIYKCRSVATKSGGAPVPGTVKKASPNERLLSRGRFDMDGEADFILEVALDVWNPMPPQQRTALVDHLLTRCVGVEDEKSGEMKYSIRPPQVQEFPEIAERHGKWNEGLDLLADSLKDK